MRMTICNLLVERILFYDSYTISIAIETRYLFKATNYIIAPPSCLKWFTSNYFIFFLFHKNKKLLFFKFDPAGKEHVRNFPNYKKIFPLDLRLSFWVELVMIMEWKIKFKLKPKSKVHFDFLALQTFLKITLKEWS